jgi:chromosome segregation ATPase
MADKVASNEDVLNILQDLMQMTSDGFARIEAVQQEQSQTLEKHGRILQEHSSLLHQHSADLSELKTSVHKLEDEQQAQRIDIAEILDRITALEQKATLTELERQEAKDKLQRLEDWVQAASKQLDIPLRHS